MKYLILLTCLFVSCNMDYATITDKGTVEKVERLSEGRYKVKVVNWFDDVKTSRPQIIDKAYYFYTTTLFNVGDTVIITKK